MRSAYNDCCLPTIAKHIPSNDYQCLSRAFDLGDDTMRLNASMPNFHVCSETTSDIQDMYVCMYVCMPIIECTKAEDRS